MGKKRFSPRRRGTLGVPGGNLGRLPLGIVRGEVVQGLCPAAGLPGCPAARLPGRILVSSRGRSWVIALGVLAEIVKSVWGGLSQLWGTIFSDCFGDSCKAPGGSGPIPVAIAVR